MGLHADLGRSAPHRRDMRQQGYGIASSRLGKDALISNDGANALTVVAVVGAPVGAARVEVEVEVAVRVVWVLRRRPVVAEHTSVVEVAAPAEASSGQEDAVAVNFAGELSTFHTVERCPFGCAVAKQLSLLVYCRHTPFATPLYVSHIMFRSTDVRANVYIVTILVKLVSTFIINLFLFRLAPSVIGAISFWFVSTLIATCPFRTRRQTKVYQVGMILVWTCWISNDGANTETAVAGGVAPAGVVRAEVEVVGAVRVVWVLRRRPVVAVLTSAVEAAAPAVASSGQEDTVAVNLADELSAVHAVESRPFGCAIVK